MEGAERRRGWVMEFPVGSVLTGGIGWIYQRRTSRDLSRSRGHSESRRNTDAAVRKRCLRSQDTSLHACCSNTPVPASIQSSFREPTRMEHGGRVLRPTFPLRTLDRWVLVCRKEKCTVVQSARRRESMPGQRGRSGRRRNGGESVC